MALADEASKNEQERRLEEQEQSYRLRDIESALRHQELEESLQHRHVVKDELALRAIDAQRTLQVSLACLRISLAHTTRVHEQHTYQAP